MKAKFQLRTNAAAVCDDNTPYKERYNLGAVHVMPASDKHVYLMATDGIALTSVKARGTADAPCMMPRDVAPRTAAELRCPRTIECNGQWTGNKRTAPPEEAFFPTYLTHHFPDNLDGYIRLGIDVDRLLNIAKAIQSGYNIIDMFIKGDETEAMVIVVGSEGVGGVMPAHGSNRPSRDGLDRQYHTHKKAIGE